jgi:integrase/recombinase XerD
MKIDRHGQAKILSQSEIQLLFSQGLQTQRDRALFGICLYCCCRINEACTLNVNDVYSKGRVIEDLRGLLIAYQHQERGYLFPGHWGKGHINSDSAARILREAFARVEIEGGSTQGSRLFKIKL